MKGLSVALSLAAGLAAAVVVGVAVTEVTQSWIEFSLFLGLPAGLLAGVIATTTVASSFAADAPARRRRIGRSAAGFGVGFLSTVIVVGLLQFGFLLALGLGAIVGAIVAVGAAVRGPPAVLQ